MSYILCLHRWVGQQALYAEYLKDSNLKLRVLCTEESKDSLPRVCCLSIEAFPSLDNAEQVLSIVEQLNQEAPFHEPMMVQEFCSAPILHVDGWWDGYELVVATVSRYSNTCAEFNENSPLGSVELSHGDEEQRILDRVKVLVAAFSPKEDLVFHLELFEDGEDLVFLEIAARVGGAEIPFMWREVRNIDLLGIAWELQTGFSTAYRDRARQLSSGSRPIQVDRGAWIIAQRHGASKGDLKTLYWAQREEKEFYASGVYEGAKPRLRFKSNHQELLLTDVQKVFLQLSEA